MSSPQPTQAPSQGPEQSQAAQAGLAIVLGLALAKLWPSLDLLDLQRSLPAFKAAVAQQVTAHAQGAGSLGVQQYRAARQAAGVRGTFAPRPADPPPLAQIVQTVDWATQPLWDSAIPAATVPGAPDLTRQAASNAIADAKARLAAGAEKLVSDVGARTVIENAFRDRQAKGWARVPEAGACSFCLMLATRGAVYKKESFAASNAKFKNDLDRPSTIKVHDHCHCQPEPVFYRYEAPARVRDAQALYRKVVTDPGRTGDDARAAFRQAVEGRKVTGVKTAPAKTGRSKSAPASAPGGRTQEQIRAELTALENNVPRLTNDQQRQWTQARIAALRSQLGPQ